MNNSLVKTNYIAFKTIIISEVIRFTRIWIQTFIPPVITMTLYFLIFGQFIGSRVGDINGVSFMQFMAPGLIMMSIITNSYQNVVSSFFGMRFQKSIDELLVAPVSNWVILSGFVLGGALRGILVGILIAIVASFFTHIDIYNIGLTFFVAFLTAILFALAGFTNSMFARKFDDIAIVPTFILTPLTYLGGVFYSVNQLTPIWRDISHLNPILYLVEAFRYGVLGISDLSIDYGLAIIIATVIVLFTINLTLLNKGIGIKT